MASRKNPYKGQDPLTAKAKASGFPARSVFKLEEIDRRTRLLRAGQKVLDLGAAPGSWSLYAAQKIGPSGRLLAVDLSPLATALPKNATFVQGDAFALDVAALPASAGFPAAPATGPAGPAFDVVLSDMAPSTSGNRLSDQTRSFELFMRALEVARTLLTPGGAFVGKIFMGEDFPAARAAVKESFAEERLIRPEGTRSVSYEIFIVGLRRR